MAKIPFRDRLALVMWNQRNRANPELEAKRVTTIEILSSPHRCEKHPEAAIHRLRVELVSGDTREYRICAVCGDVLTYKRTG